MKIIKILAITSLFFSSFLVVEKAQAAGCIPSKNEFYCVEFLRNYDGDTLTVNIPNIHPFFGDSMSVRIRDIDSPELRTDDPCEKELGLIAKAYVEERLTNARSIELRNVARDKYFRILASVFVDGRYLERELIRDGLAVSYDGGTKPQVNWCKMLENYRS